MSEQTTDPRRIRLERDLRSGALNRREFVTYLAALGVATGAALGYAGSALAQTPKRGGTMKLAMGHGSTNDTWDPAVMENGFEATASRAFTSTLTELDVDGELQPCLAESWEASADAKTWTFRLRQGVEFHNGRSMTVEDVIASINYHRKEDSKSAVKPLAAPIVDIRKVDDRTLVFELEGGNADFPFNMDNFHFAIYPATGAGEIDWRSAHGTGAYLLKNYDPGVRAQFERNPNYWNPERGHVDACELLSIGDPAARTNALVTGEVHAIDQVDLKTAGRMAHMPGVIIEETSGPLHYTFPMHMDVAPFDNVDVRLALKLALDREELLQKVLLGHGTLGNDTPIGPSYRYHAALEQRSYDPEQARFHLKKAGAEGLKVKLHAADAAFAGAVDAAVLYREQALKAGIDIEVVREPNDGYWSNVWLKKPWCACYWGGYATEDTMFSTGYAPDAAWNDTHWNNDRFNTLMVQARAELDAARRREMYTEMQRMLRDEGGAVVPMFANAVMARSEKVAHGKVSSSSSFDGRRIIERWWMTES